MRADGFQRLSRISMGYSRVNFFVAFMQIPIVPTNGVILIETLSSFPYMSGLLVNFIQWPPLIRRRKLQAVMYLS